MQIIDTHSHLYMNQFNKDLDEVIENSIESGVKKIICIGVDLKTSHQSLEIAEKYSQVYASAGVHPHEAKYCSKNYIKTLEDFSTHPKIVAIGEIGLDYFYKNSDVIQQLKTYFEQLELAKSLNLPAIVHCRNADNDIISGITHTNNNYGVIHCFASNLEFAKQILNLGFHLSFTGLITFAKELEDVVRNVPIDKIMLETDSPYLTPKPYRGKRNEPKYVKYVAEMISKIKNISTNEIMKQTTLNAESFFKKINET